MKTTSSYKIKLIEEALKESIDVRVTVRGDGSRDVSSLVNIQHTVLLYLGGSTNAIAVDPDEIMTVWVREVPSSLKPKAI